MITFARRVKPIPYAPKYFVDGLGNVYSTMKGKWRKLKRCVGSHGYYVVNVTNNGTTYHSLVHRLMLDTFGVFKKSKEVRHLDGCKLNNHLCNLLEDTASENMYDMKRHNPMYFVGERNNHSKLTEVQVKEIRALYATGNYTQGDLAKKYGVTTGAISPILMRLHWVHI